MPPAPRPPRRSLAPWLALTVVLLGGYLASAATKSPTPPAPPSPSPAAPSPAAPSPPSPSPAAPSPAAPSPAAPARAGRAPDIQDTHDRLDRIYRKLGLRSDRPARRDDDDQGCRCGRERQAQPLPGHEPAHLAAPAMPPFLGYLLLGVILAAMLVPLYFALRRSYPSRDTAGQAAAEDEDAAPGAKPPRQPWRVDLGEARRLHDQGKLPEAFAALHRAALLALERARQLSLDETVTNWEYVRRLSSKPELRDTLGAVTLAAEQSVLGQRPPDGGHFLALEQRLLGTTWGDA